MGQFPKLLSILIILVAISSYPVFAVSSTTPKVISTSSMTQMITVNVPEYIGISSTWNGDESSSIDLGNLSFNGLENSWQGGVSGLQLRSLSNVNIDLYIKASGNLTDTDTGATIPLSNLYSAGYDNSKAKAPVTTNYKKVINGWARPSDENKFIPVDLYLTVPLGTKPGTYITTIYYTAIKNDNSKPV